MADYNSVYADFDTVFISDTQFEINTDSVLGDPAGGSSPPVPPVDEVKYYMRAYRALSSGFVHWISPSTPDKTGVLSGYNPAELTDIIVTKVLK